MQHGVDLSKPIIFSCRTSMTASGLFFGAYTLELKNISLYSVSIFRKETIVTYLINLI